MGTSTYPGTLDNFSTDSGATPANLGDDDSTARNHSERHGDLEAAVENIEAELGTDPAGSLSTVAARLTATEWNVTKTGRWVAPGASNAITSTALTANTMVGPVYLVAVAHTLQSIAIHISSAGTSGSVVRLGIYQADSNGVDFTLVLDAGTIDGTATGAAAATINQALTPGLYWLVAVGQGGPTTQPTPIGSNFAAGGIAHHLSHTSAANTGQSTVGLLYTTTVSGALPSTVTNAQLAPWVPRIPVQIA